MISNIFKNKFALSIDKLILIYYICSRLFFVLFILLFYSFLPGSRDGHPAFLKKSFYV